jgi:hypothetical protein
MHDNGGNGIISWSLLLSDSVQQPNSYLETKDFTRLNVQYVFINSQNNGRWGINVWINFD